MRLYDYVRQKKNEIIISVVGFFLATVLLGTVLVIGQEYLKQWFLGTRVRIKLLASASGVFVSGTDRCVRQITSYEVTTTDLTREVKISVTFAEQTKIISANVIYTVDLVGFTQSAPAGNSLALELKHPLDAAKRAQVFLITERPFRSTDQVTSQLPDIHVEGKDKNGNVLYH